MKIAYIVPKLAQKGPVTVAYELVCLMMAHGHECTVFHFDDGPDELGFPCETRRISWRGGRAAEGGPGGLDFNRFDIVHSHGLRPDAYVCLHRPFRPARSHARCISTLHNYVFEDLRYQYNHWTAFWAGRAWLAALRRHDTVVTLSRDALRYYSRFLPAHKLTYAYNTRRLPDDTAQGGGLLPLTEAERAEATGFAAACPHLIGVHAQLTARKGIDQLLRVLPQLPDHRLLIIGDGPARAELERQAAAEGIADRVRFLGYRPNASRYLPLYTLYALPSRSEGFPLALLEAAAQDVAVVCSDLPVFEELVTANEVAFFELENPEALCAAIVDATARKAELARNLHARYRAAFSPEHFYIRYLEIYESI